MNEHEMEIIKPIDTISFKLGWGKWKALWVLAWFQELGVVKISGHERKTGKGGQVGDVQHSHMYVGNVDREVKGEKDPTL